MTLGGSPANINGVVVTPILVPSARTNLNIESELPSDIGVTRSGHCHVAPEDPTKRKETEVPLRKKVTEQEAADFLKFMQASEYKIIDQLRKTPRRYRCWLYS